MDTTAAAELGRGVLGAGVDSLSYPNAQVKEQEAFGSSEGADNSESRGHAKPLLPEASQKKMRMMPATAYFPGGYFSGAELTSSTTAVAAAADEMWYANPWQGAAAVTSAMSMDSSYAPPGFGASAAPACGEAGRGRNTGSIFYKTKLCSKFKLGACPFDSRCNFAHGVEELRKPPQGWEAQEPHPPAVPGSRASRAPPDSQKFKTRPCKFFKETNSCPYGDRCTFLHDGGGVDNTCTSWSSAGGDCGVPNRPANYKTKICNQWEATGNCTFADKCHFAHGPTELQRPGNGASYPKVSDAVIYDCGISWNPTQTSDQDQQQQQQQQQQQMPEASTGFMAYSGYAYQQIPYYRPQVYGYGQAQYTLQTNGFYSSTGNHQAGGLQQQQQEPTSYNYEWNES